MKTDTEEVQKSSGKAGKGPAKIKKRRRKSAKRKGPEPKKLDFVQDSWGKGSLEPKKLGFLEGRWRKGSLEPKKLDFMEDHWRKGSLDPRMLYFVEDLWQKGPLEPKKLDFDEDRWRKGSLEPEKLDFVEDSWRKDSFEAMKLDFADYNWVSIDNRRVSEDSKRSSVDSKGGSVDSRRGSVESRRRSADSKRGSADSKRGSADSKRGSIYSTRFSVDSKRSSIDSKRASVDSKRFSVDSKRFSIDSKRSSVDSKRSSVDSRKSSGGNMLDFSEDRRSLGEDGDISISNLARVRHNRVPWATLMRALGRFKLYLPDIRRYYNLSSRDPLALDTDLLQPREKHRKPIVKKFWGNQQPLSKIPYKVLLGHDHTVSSCHFCMDDTRFLSSSYDCTVKLWDAEDGTVICEFEPRPKAPVLECSITADSRRIVASSYDKTVRAWDVETGQLLWKIRHDTFVVCCKFSPNGKYVLTALDVDRGIYLMDSENITSVIHMKAHHQRSITSCCFDPDSQKVASVSMDRCIKIWDMTSRATLFTIRDAHTNAISDCCFTFSGHFLCTSSWDKNIKIWNVHTGEFRNRGACVTLMKGHEGCVSSCCIARDSSFLISGGFDKTVAIWDVGGGYRKLALKGHENWVTDVAISNDKKWILSASKLFSKFQHASLYKTFSFIRLIRKRDTVGEPLLLLHQMGTINKSDFRLCSSTGCTAKTGTLTAGDSSMRLWNIEEIDKIPLVTENKKAMGLKCRNCDQLFSTLESDVYSQLSNTCLFCRREEKNLSSSSSSSSLSFSSLERLHL